MVAKTGKAYGLTHVRILVKDLEKSLLFYQTLVGMEVIKHAGSTVFLRTIGNKKDILTITQDPKASKKLTKMGGVKHFGFCFKEPIRVKTFIKKIIKLGGKIYYFEGKKSHARIMVMAYDPDGYIVEFYWEEDWFWKYFSKMV